MINIMLHRLATLNGFQLSKEVGINPKNHGKEFTQENVTREEAMEILSKVDYAPIGAKEELLNPKKIIIKKSYGDYYNPVIIDYLCNPVAQENINKENFEFAKIEVVFPGFFYEYYISYKDITRRVVYFAPDRSGETGTLYYSNLTIYRDDIPTAIITYNTRKNLLMWSQRPDGRNWNIYKIDTNETREELREFIDYYKGCIEPDIYQFYEQMIEILPETELANIQYIKDLVLQFLEVNDIVYRYILHDSKPVGITKAAVMHEGRLYIITQKIYSANRYYYHANAICMDENIPVDERSCRISWKVLSDEWTNGHQNNADWDNPYSVSTLKECVENW
jgi:hypothetical protein